MDLFAEQISPFNTVLSRVGLSSKKVDGLAFLESFPHKDKFSIFNKGRDQVFCNRENYFVDYEWYKSEFSNIRVELMRNVKPEPRIHNGFGKGEVLHGSFKMENAMEYHRALKLLDGAGLKCVQHFVAEYGLFSYWEIAGTTGFLKPRVNLRD